MKGNSLEFKAGFAPFGETLEMFGNFRDVQRARKIYADHWEQADSRRSRTRESIGATVREPVLVRERIRFK